MIFILFRFPSYYGRNLDYLQYNIHSKQHFDALKKIYELSVKAEYITQDVIDKIITNVEKKMEWFDKNLENIDTWLSGDTPTDPTPTATTPTDTTPTDTTPTDTTPNSSTSEQPTSTESTTLGASSLIVSLTALILCSLVKFIT